MSTPSINIPSSMVFAQFNSAHPNGSLAVLCKDLHRQQVSEWPFAADHYAALSTVRTREIACSTFSVHLQYNPHRITSTGADVTMHALKHRHCFLCIEHLPEQQKGILYNDTFLILCNPIPIFPFHLTVSKLEHHPQSLEHAFDVFLSIAKDIGPALSVFYNGAQCGASAPDHLHFQICPSGMIPVELDILQPQYREQISQKDDVQIYGMKNYGRQVLILESGSSTSLHMFFSTLLHSWKQIEQTNEEPKFNIIASYDDTLFRIILFPRTKHRPDIFFKPDQERVIISPATVDMGGLIITPREQDFLQTNASLIESIYHEVTVPESFLPQLISTIVGL